MKSITFGDRLKSLRLSYGLTQAELAEQIHLSATCINRYEHNLREPGIGIISAISDFFDVDCNYLLGKSGKMPALNETDLILILKFHALDDRGKAAVLNALEFEYRNTAK